MKQPFPYRAALDSVPLAAAAALGLFLAGATRADELQMVNGDRYRGSIIGMTATNVEFKSEIMGLVKIPRDKVAHLALGDQPPVKASIPGTTNTIKAPAGLVKAGARGTNSALVGRPVFRGTNGVKANALPAGSIDPGMVQQVQEQILNGAGPEATVKFNQMVASLAAGTLTVDSVKQQAHSAIRDIKNAKAEFGPEAGDILDAYLKILQDFVAEADGPAGQQ